jgi:hypothetical protein
MSGKVHRRVATCKPATSRLWLLPDPCKHACLCRVLMEHGARLLYRLVGQPSVATLKLDYICTPDLLWTSLFMWSWFV